MKTLNKNDLDTCCSEENIQYFKIIRHNFTMSIAAALDPMIDQRHIVAPLHRTKVESTYMRRLYDINRWIFVFEIYNHMREIL